MEDEAARPSPRADLVTSGVWAVIGTAIAVGSWRMDRLASQGVEWFTAPGLLPGILGVLIVLVALLISWRALPAMRAAPPPAAERAGGTLARAALTLALCLGFAVGLVGHGLPFWAAASTYLFLHIFLLQLPERRAQGEVRRGAAVAAAIALGAGIGISLVFQELFLVRLP